ncbi:MAG: MATE family efflux transporter [Pseudomonadota bacterium]
MTPTRTEPAPAPWYDEARALTVLAGPIVATGLAEVAISTTDVVMMGWLGTAAVAAGILGIHTHGFLYLVGLGLLAAVAPMIAQALGAGRREQIAPLVRTGLVIALILSVAGIAVLLNASVVLGWLGQASEVTVRTQTYLSARVWGLPAQFGILVLAHLLAAHSRPKPVMVITLIAIVANAALNYLLMFGHYGWPALGLTGAGIASVVVEWAAFIALAIFVARDRDMGRYRDSAFRWLPDGRELAAMLALGLPISGAVMAEAGLFLASTFMLGWFGEQQLAAHAVAIQCTAVSYMVPYGISQAATVRVGLAVGARNDVGARRAAWTALIGGTVFTLLPASCFWWLGPELAALYLDPADPANAVALAFAVKFLALAALFQLMDGAQVIAMGALRGYKDTRIPMLLAVGAYWGLGFGAALAAALFLDYGGTGVWVGLVAGLAAAAVMLTLRLASLSRPTRGELR